jgi:hypothetical protein
MVKISKLLIAGDSFSAIWPNGESGWPNLLTANFNVTNISQAGVGEYKIFKQLNSIDINNFDVVIVSHTSPSRIHTLNHPLHKTGFHKDCDLIYTDLENRFDWFNKNLQASKNWFEYHYDDEYQIDIYQMIRRNIKSIIKKNYISITHTEISKNLSVESNNIDFSNLWHNNKGFVNHYNSFGNQQVYHTLKDRILEINNK